MKESITELVNVILQHLEESGSGARTETGIRRWLAGEGYSKRDIEAAIKMVAPRIAAKALVQSSPQGTTRHLAPFEVLKLSAEARDALIRLDLYELITPIEREMLLERIAQYDGEVGLDELDYVLGWMLYNARDVESQQTIYGVVDGMKGTVH